MTSVSMAIHDNPLSNDASCNEKNHEKNHVGQFGTRTIKKDKILFFHVRELPVVVYLDPQSSTYMHLSM